MQDIFGENYKNALKDIKEDRNDIFMGRKYRDVCSLKTDPQIQWIQIRIPICYSILFYYFRILMRCSYKIYMKAQRCQKLKKSKKWGCSVLKTKTYGKLE